MKYQRIVILFTSILLFISALAVVYNIGNQRGRREAYKARYEKTEPIVWYNDKCVDTISEKWIDHPNLLQNMEVGDTGFIRTIIVDSSRHVWVSLEEEVIDSFTGWQEVMVVRKGKSDFVINLSNCEFRKQLMFAEKMVNTRDYVRVCVVEGKHD